MPSGSGVGLGVGGWNEPEEHEFEHGFKERQELIEVIARLRGREAIRNNQWYKAG